MHKTATLPLLLLFMLLVACVPIPPEAMQPMPQVYQQIPVNDELQGAVKLGDVRLADNLGGMTLAMNMDTSIEQKDYRKALETALAGANMAAASGSREKYVLDANLMALDIPFALIKVTVKSTAHYQLRRVDDNRIVMNETLKLSYTATFSEALDGSQRFRIALANAIRENITHMIRVLSSKTEVELLGKGV